jgi:hypothetical protein
MRALARAFAVLVLLAPRAAAAQADEFAQAAALEGESSAIWILDDGIGVDDVPWNEYDAQASYLPRERLHFGAMLRAAWLPGGGPMVPEGPVFDLSGFLDYRYSDRSPIRFRIAIALTAQDYRDENVGAGMWRTSSPWSLRLRIYPFSIDIQHLVTLRVAGDLGFQWYPRPDVESGGIAFMTGTTGEALLRFLDGALEVGVYGGIQTTAVATTSRVNAYDSLQVQGVLGGLVGYNAP